ncbi:unnamed protein product, partial [Ilex paraguariensis]
AEVKSGQQLPVEAGEGIVLHLSQASLGEVKGTKGNESVSLFVNVDGKKLVLGTLFSDKLPQQQFDLVFDRDFELSHNWKNGKSDSEDELPLPVANNGKPEAPVKQNKPNATEKANAVKDSAAGKQKVKIVEPNKFVKPEEDDDSSDEDASMDDLGSDEDDESDSEGEDESDEEDEETPKKVSVTVQHLSSNLLHFIGHGYVDTSLHFVMVKLYLFLLKVELGKKRTAESATKTPGPDKKAKMNTPQKTGDFHVFCYYYFPTFN